jgi:hypothetical protein
MIFSLELPESVVVLGFATSAIQERKQAVQIGEAMPFAGAGIFQ